MTTNAKIVKFVQYSSRYIYRASVCVSGITMQKVIVSKKNYEVSRARSHRPIDIAQSLIPMNANTPNTHTHTHNNNNNSNCNTIVSAIFHKSMYGHVLITLNDKCHPINAWSDIQGIIPIKCRRIRDSQKFSSLLQAIKPKILHLNDAEILKDIPKTCQLQAYHNKTLLNILEDLQQQSAQVNVAEASLIKNLNIPSFEDMQIMDPTMSRKQYKKFKQSLLKSL